MKTYVITLSAVFPKTHSRAGQPTDFAEKFRKTKLHTIRANYTLWFKRFEQIDNGEACLSVRQWTGLPYRSKQIEIARLTKDDGISLQKIQMFRTTYGHIAYRIDGHQIQDTHNQLERIAKLDGLTIEDWEEWFKGYDFSKPMALINFTNRRYQASWLADYWYSDL